MYNLQFDNWRNNFSHKLNWIRIMIHSDKNVMEFIGLNCNTIDVDSSTLYNNVNKNKLCWVVFSSSGLYQLAFTYNKIYNNPKYSYLELNFAKQNIDNFLIKLNKNKSFT